MATTSFEARDAIADWPELAREAAGLVIDAHGEPPEIAWSELRWFGVGPWKRIVAQRSV